MGGAGSARTLPGKGRSAVNSALPPPPGGGGSRDAVPNSPRASIISTDSGIGTSVGGEVRRPSLRKAESKSVPNSGSGVIARDVGTGSADAEFRIGVKVRERAV